MTAVSSTPSPGFRGRAGALVAWSRSHVPLLATPAVVALILAGVLTGTFSGLFPGSHRDLGPPPGIVMVGSSWVTGEPSLQAWPEFSALEQRAEQIANSRWAARQALIAEIAAAKRAAALKRREDLLRKYAEERAKQLAAYHALLLKIERERAAQEAKLAAARRKYQQELAAYLHKLTVTPGKECQDPAVRQAYTCGNGMLPHKGVP